jgi:hypothetical protein
MSKVNKRVQLGGRSRDERGGCVCVALIDLALENTTKCILRFCMKLKLSQNVLLKNLLKCFKKKENALTCPGGKFNQNLWHQQKETKYGSW